MSVAAFLAELRSRDIEIWAEGERLRCNAPAGSLAPELRDQLQQRKGDILKFLRSAEALARQQRAIVPLQPHGERAAVFAVAGHNGDVFCYRALAQQLGEDQPFFGLEPPGLDGRGVPLDRVEALAAYFAAQVRAFRPDGPYVIAGYCAGGTIAFELARQLQEQGAAVSFLALFASPYHTWYRWLPQFGHRLRLQWDRLGKHVEALASLSFRERRSYVVEKLRQHRAEQARRLAEPDPVRALRARIQRATIAGVCRYAPRPFAGRLGLFLPSKEWLDAPNPLLRWRSLARDSEAYCGPDGSHGDRMLLAPDVVAVAESFRRCRDANAP